MASKVVIFAGLLLLLAALCHAESADKQNEENSDTALVRPKRELIGWIIASFGDALKLFWDGMNKGVKGLLTGLTFAFLGFFAGISNGLQLWRLGIYFGLNGIVDLAQNLLELVLLSPLHMNFFVKCSCLQETKGPDMALQRRRRYIPLLTTLIAGLGDGLKLIIDGLNIGTKGLITGATYLVLGWWTGWSNGLQKWRLGFYTLGNGAVDLVQNVIGFLTFSPLHTNLLGENHL